MSRRSRGVLLAFALLASLPVAGFAAWAQDAGGQNDTSRIKVRSEAGAVRAVLRMDGGLDMLLPQDGPISVGAVFWGRLARRPEDLLNGPLAPDRPLVASGTGAFSMEPPVDARDLVTPGTWWLLWSRTREESKDKWRKVRLMVLPPSPSWLERMVWSVGPDGTLPFPEPPAIWWKNASYEIRIGPDGSWRKLDNQKLLAPLLGRDRNGYAWVRAVWADVEAGSVESDPVLIRLAVADGNAEKWYEPTGNVLLILSSFAAGFLLWPVVSWILQKKRGQWGRVHPVVKPSPVSGEPVGEQNAPPCSSVGPLATQIQLVLQGIGEIKKRLPPNPSPGGTSAPPATPLEEPADKGRAWPYLGSGTAGQGLPVVAPVGTDFGHYSTPTTAPLVEWTAEDFLADPHRQELEDASSTVFATIRDNMHIEAWTEWQKVLGELSLRYGRRPPEVIVAERTSPLACARLAGGKGLLLPTLLDPSKLEDAYELPGGLNIPIVQRFSAVTRPCLGRPAIDGPFTIVSKGTFR